MMKKKHFIKLIILIISIFYTNQLKSQVPIGTFTSHLSYTGIYSVAATPQYVYGASQFGLMYYQKNNAQIHTLTKVEGLSATEISRIYYDEESKYLIISYVDGNLDFLKNDNLINVPDVKDKTLSGSKNLNRFFVYNHVLYLAYSFGIVSIDLNTLLVIDNWVTRSAGHSYEVNDMEMMNDEFYIATSNGVFHTPITNSAAADFSTWQRIDELGDAIYTELCLFQEKLYACKHTENDTLLYLDRNGWQYSTIHIRDIRSIETQEDSMLVATSDRVFSYDTEEMQHEYALWDDYVTNRSVQEAVWDGENIWVADDHLGLIRLFQDHAYQFVADGPYLPSVYDMDIKQGWLAVVGGNRTSTWGNTYTPGEFSFYYRGIWRSILRISNYEQINGFADYLSLAIDPIYPNLTYVGSWGYGLVRYNGNNVDAIFNRNNTPLQSRSNGEAFIGGMAFDGDKNLWMVCSYSSYPLVVRKRDGTWQSIPLNAYVSGYNTTISQILIDSRNYKWIVFPRDNRLVVFDDHGTISNLSDDRSISVNMNIAANIETNTINCIADDKNGDIWIGCNQGIKVVYNAGNVFSGNVYAQNILVEQMNYVQNLFEFEEVTAIAVDAANRKWVGTMKSGVYLISEDGSEQLLHFTEENSPLFSNKINSIKINPDDGEVYIATSCGLISYRGTATSPSENYKEVKVFPNPVTENYHGLIAISGLKDHSFCKIVDSAGNLVWQDYSKGGTFTWNGKDFYGHRPSTGVYFVFISDADGKKYTVTKILFVK